MEPAELRRIARTISTVENQADGYEDILAQAYRLPRWADVIGITGPPGAGKSTLVDALAAHWAESGERVAILAIDPSSPYSGGAVLGDRIRRTRSAGYANTYFRSLSSRGHVGGLSETATDLVAVLSLFQFRRIIIETVGAGQADIEIHETADCTAVVTVPGLGDGVQAAKAGLMEIGDIFAINKADMPGAESAARTVEDALAAVYMGEPGINKPERLPAAVSRSASAMPGLIALHRRHGDYATDESVWVPPVLRLTSAENKGVAELARAIDQFVAWSEHSGRRAERSRERAYAQIVRMLSARLLAPFVRAPGATQWPAAVHKWVEKVAAGAASPVEAADALVKSLKQ
jgi:LAO/AO transport system kinase